MRHSTRNALARNWAWIIALPVLIVGAWILYGMLT